MNKRRQKRGKGNVKNKKQTKQAVQLNSLSPQKLAVIAALLTDALEVNSILIDKDQTVQIVLEGSLRRKTRMDELIQELSGMKFGEVIQSIQRMS